MVPPPEEQMERQKRVPILSLQGMQGTASCPERERKHPDPLPEVPV